MNFSLIEINKYHIGMMKDNSGAYKWMDGTTPPAIWMPAGIGSQDDCIMSSTATPWSRQHCSYTGGYICELGVHGESSGGQLAY